MIILRDNTLTLLLRAFLNTDNDFSKNLQDIIGNKWIDLYLLKITIDPTTMP